MALPTSANKAIPSLRLIVIAQRVNPHGDVTGEVLRVQEQYPDRELPNIRFGLPNRGMSSALGGGALSL